MVPFWTEWASSAWTTCLSGLLAAMCSRRETGSSSMKRPAKDWATEVARRLGTLACTRMGSEGGPYADRGRTPVGEDTADPNSSASHPGVSPAWPGSTLDEPPRSSPRPPLDRQP